MRAANEIHYTTTPRGTEGYCGRPITHNNRTPVPAYASCKDCQRRISGEPRKVAARLGSLDAIVARNAAIAEAIERDARGAAIVAVSYSTAEGFCARLLDVSRPGSMFLLGECQRPRQSMDAAVEAARRDAMNRPGLDPELAWAAPLVVAEVPS